MRILECTFEEIMGKEGLIDLHIFTCFIFKAWNWKVVMTYITQNTEGLTILSMANVRDRKARPGSDGKARM